MPERLMPTVHLNHDPPPPSKAAYAALAVVLLVGIGLRLLWLDDMEYKADEAWTWQRAAAAGHTEPLSWVGMPTSAGPENPGMSLWIFLPLAWVSQGPVDMARGVAWLSMAAIAVWVWFACRRVPAAEREMWLWAAALAAVHPLSVLHHRKIWPNCLFPLLVSLFLMCWYRRDRRWGAFGWGVLGSCVAQINLSAGFFALGFALWAWLADRRQVAWKSWLAGSVLASWPLIPWCYYIVAVSTQPRLTTTKVARLFEGKFLVRWLSEPFGIGLDHALGDDFFDFLRQPVVGGVPTCLVGALHLAALAIAVTIGYRWFKSADSWRSGWRQAFFPTDSFSGLVTSAAFWGYGVLLTLTCLPLHRQYMIIVYPIELLWVAQAALWLKRHDGAAWRAGRRLLAQLVVVELLITFSFLSYVHTKRDIRGDYGVAFSVRTERR